jgi:DNA-binding XRE family transcriptional regulator
MKGSPENPDPRDFSSGDGSLEITRIPAEALGREVGYWLQNARRRAGLKRSEVARRLNISKKDIRKLEEGRVPEDELYFITTALFVQACGYTFAVRIRPRDEQGAEKEIVF